ncbi:MAG: DUF6036 family nucleotidyltransferase [Planctomycetota bacterium]
MPNKYTFRSLVANTIKLLSENKIPYVTIGGLASDVWGRPRKTLDIDIVVQIGPEKAESFLNLAEKYHFRFDYPTALKQITNMGMCRLFYGDYHSDIIMGYSEFEQGVFDRKRKVRILGRDVWVASPEDVILYKLLSNRPIDQSDVENIVAAQGSKLDVGYLKKRAAIMNRELLRADIKTNLDKIISALK